MDACAAADVEGRTIVAPCASASPPGCVHFGEVGNENDADDDGLVDAKADGDGDEGVTVNEIRSACFCVL